MKLISNYIVDIENFLTIPVNKLVKTNLVTINETEMFLKLVYY